MYKLTFKRLFFSQHLIRKEMTKKYTICAVIAILCFLACERKVVTDPESNDNDSDSEYFENEDDYQWDTLSATKINLKGDVVEIIGDGAIFEGNQVLIQDGGDFWIKGELNNGQIRVQSASLENVKLILDNANITCNNNAAIVIEQSERSIIILADGSENNITDGSSYDTEEANSALFSKSDLAISGNGKLTINANYNDAITSKDGLIIRSGNYVITAVDDGIRGKDYLVIEDGVFDITSGGDAIKSDNENAGFGYIDISYGAFEINSKGDGIQAQYNLTIDDGVFNISCSGYPSSSKGLKAGIQLQIDGGEFNIDGIDDALHSDQDIYITKGDFTISTSDDGMHAENILKIDYADILILESYEGLEAKSITIVDGNIVLTSSDDGINAASGTQSYPGGPVGDNNLKIEGGYIVADSRGDGLDINGSIDISGGLIIVHGPTEDMNGALDCDGTFVMNGGFLVAAGSSGMAESPGSSSTQYSVLINFTSSFSANTLFNLQDTDGNEIVTFRPDKTYQSVAISSPDLANGTTYNIYTGGSTTGSESNGLYSNGEYTPGTLYESFTITGISTTIGESAGPGGPGGPPPGGLIGVGM